MSRRTLPLLLLAVLLAGCSKPRHVSGAEFQQECALGNHQTMVQSEYIGEKDGSVYLRRKTMSLLNKDEWKEELWYTETGELDPEFLKQLRKGPPRPE